MKYLGVGDFVHIAQGALEPAAGRISAEQVTDAIEFSVLTSVLMAPQATIAGVERYEGLALKAAILCVRIARSQPLRYGNNVVAFAAMHWMITTNGGKWKRPKGGDSEVVSVI